MVRNQSTVRTAWMARQFSDDGMEWPFSWSPPGRGCGGESASAQFLRALDRVERLERERSEHAEQAQQQQHHEQHHDDPDDVAHGHRGPP
jgi:hypothetical protein